MNSLGLWDSLARENVLEALERAHWRVAVDPSLARVLGEKGVLAVGWLWGQLILHGNPFR